jgi:hypothetical protein
MRVTRGQCRPRESRRRGVSTAESTAHVRSSPGSCGFGEGGLHFFKGLKGAEVGRHLLSSLLVQNLFWFHNPC